MWIHLVAAVFQLTFMATRHHYTKPMTVEQCLKSKRCVVATVPAADAPKNCFHPDGVDDGVLLCQADAKK